jgi:hypothetical protein
MNNQINQPVNSTAVQNALKYQVYMEDKKNLE